MQINQRQRCRCLAPLKLRLWAPYTAYTTSPSPYPAAVSTTCFESPFEYVPRIPAACPVLLLWAKNNITVAAVKAVQICINRQGERINRRPCPSDIPSRRKAKRSSSFSLLPFVASARIIFEENVTVIERIRRKYSRCNASLGIFA